MLSEKYRQDNFEEAVKHFEIAFSIGKFWWFIYKISY